MTYQIRDLVFQDRDFLEQLPPRFEVTFEDGEVRKVTRRTTIYSHFFWETIRRYPRLKILYKHHLHQVLGGKPLHDGSHRDLLSNLLESIVLAEGLHRYEQKEPLLKLIYDITSECMRFLTVVTSKHVVGLNILDFIQIAHHPEIEKACLEAYKDPTKIRYAYDYGMTVIKKDPALAENNLAKAVRAGVVSTNQVAQCVMFRGYGSEVDGVRYPTPIWSNYTKGMRKFYDFVADSRTAAKSYYYSEAPLQDSEYTARQFQLYSSVLQHLVEEDCGNTPNTPWLIHPTRVDESGAVVYSGDLGFLIGKEYLDPETGEHGWIRGDEKHLVGKTVLLRFILKCRVRNPHYVCRHCAGQLSHNISRFANLGHLGCVSTTRQATQNILSIKHVNTSSVAIQILLGEYQQKWLNSGPNGDAFYLNEELESMLPSITISKEEASGLMDVILHGEDSDINVHNVSAVKNIRINYVDRDGFKYEPVVPVTQGNRTSLLSYEMLEYVRENGVSVDPDNNFQIDMKDWDFKNPILILPNMEYSYSELAKQIENMVKSNRSNNGGRVRKGRDSPESLLRSLFDLTNSKLKVNVLSLEIMVAAMKVRAEDDYSMVPGGEEGVLGMVNLLISTRSLGSALPFEKQDVTVLNASSFFKGTRPDSPFDVLFTPREVVEAKRLLPPHNLSTFPAPLSEP